MKKYINRFKENSPRIIIESFVGGIIFGIILLIYYLVQGISIDIFKYVGTICIEIVLAMILLSIGLMVRKEN